MFGGAHGSGSHADEPQLQPFAVAAIVVGARRVQTAAAAMAVQRRRCHHRGCWQWVTARAGDLITVAEGTHGTEPTAG